MRYTFVERDAAVFISDASAKTSKFESPILQTPNQSDFHLLHRNNIGRSSKLNHPVNAHRLNIRSPSRGLTIHHMCQLPFITSSSPYTRGRYITHHIIRISHNTSIHPENPLKPD